MFIWFKISSHHLSILCILYSYLTCYCDETPDKKQLKEGWFYSGLHLKDAMPCGGEGKAANT